MPKTYTLAILADTCTTCVNNSILRYTTITANSHSEACTLAAQIGALVCGWRVVA
ncbi:hypothetical protein [Endozoicomonas sp. SESOKO1]|uniref:hypothetical protein n=1 Tax=Endozoicomonas sp. SESOKO1 TaxID=2828742 RepID=UPI0021474D73|nr:hypothetical protein [Endozoicomonas sp. SESOKO1]